MSELVHRGPWTVPSTSVYEVEHSGRDWQITVAHATTDGGPTPVVYVLDPFGTLMSSVQIARTTHMLSQGALPSLLVVGVGPRSDDFLELSQRRMLDLTPSDPAANAGAPELEYGGADAFLDLLVDVVAPGVESKHGGDPADRTLAGCSLGGLTTAHALLTRPTDFRRYLMVSPSLWWADAAILTQVAGTSTAGPREVYLASGELEETSGDRYWPPLPEGTDPRLPAQCRMVTNLRQFAGSLRALPDVTVHEEVLAGEHHITLWPAAFTRGLLALHAPSYRLSGASFSG